MDWSLLERERALRLELRAAKSRTAYATALRVIVLGCVAMLPALCQGEPAAWFVSGAAFMAITRDLAHG